MYKLKGWQQPEGSLLSMIDIIKGLNFMQDFFYDERDDWETIYVYDHAKVLYNHYHDCV